MAQFLIGLIVIIKGADILTDGAASIARLMGIPTIVVGMTIVAVGSSMPEFVVSVLSALKGSTDMALGNIIGSNIFNILGILGITAIFSPIVVNRNNVKYDVPFVLLSSLCIVITALDSLFCFGNEVGLTPSQNSISRTDGLMMLCIFVIFIMYTLSIAKNSDNGVNAEDENVKSMKMSKSIIYVIIGLAMLIFGGNWLVSGASGMAISWGMSESIVALTIVSIGTSAPELAASVVAARKDDTAMALGNVVGSVVFNVLFVLGTSAAICPLQVAGITYIDIATLIVASVVLWLFCRLGKTYYTITRLEGAMLVLLAVFYYGYLVYNAL